MLAHTVPARLRPAESLQALERAVARAVVVKGERDEAAELAPRLLRMLEEAAPQSRSAVEGSDARRAIGRDEAGQRPPEGRNGPLAQGAGAPPCGLFICDSSISRQPSSSRCSTLCASGWPSPGSPGVNLKLPLVHARKA